MFYSFRLRDLSPKLLHCKTYTFKSVNQTGKLVYHVAPCSSQQSWQIIKLLVTQVPFRDTASNRCIRLKRPTLQDIARTLQLFMVIQPKGVWWRCRCLETLPSCLALQCLQVTVRSCKYRLVSKPGTGFTHSLCLFYLRVLFLHLCLSESVSSREQVFLTFCFATAPPPASSCFTRKIGCLLDQLTHLHCIPASVV